MNVPENRLIAGRRIPRKIRNLITFNSDGWVSVAGVENVGKVENEEMTNAERPTRDRGIERDNVG